MGMIRILEFHEAQTYIYHNVACDFTVHSHLPMKQQPDLNHLCDTTLCISSNHYIISFIKSLNIIKVVCVTEAQGVWVDFQGNLKHSLLGDL